MTEQTPADQNSFGSEIITDTEGRKLTYKSLSAVEFGRFLRAAGSEHSSNNGFLQYAAISLSVRAIDGVPAVFPTNIAMIDAAIARLGDAGYQAVFDWVSKEQADGGSEIDAAKN